MVTLPPDRPMGRPPTGVPALGRLHGARQLAESFGADAEAYDRARPSYPAPLVARIAEAMPGPDLLDVGIGTGLAATQFADAGCQVRGVDPDERMAGFARRRGLAVDVARFEDWDGGGARFDGVVAAQAWHWVDPHVGARKAAEVLRPGGLLAVFWNAFVLPERLKEAVAGAYRRVLPGAPFVAGMLAGVAAYDRQLTAAVDGIEASGRFGTVERRRLDWEQPVAAREWLEQVPTFGGHNMLDRATLGALLDGIGQAIQAAGGDVAVRYATVGVTAFAGS